MLHPYSEIAKGSATKGDIVNALLPFIPGSTIATISSKAKIAAVALKPIEKLPVKTKINLTPTSVLKSRFENLKKTEGVSEESLNKSRFELALKDATLASKAKGFIPIMDLPKTNYSKLYQENLNLKSFDEPIPSDAAIAGLTDIDNGRYVFRFTKGGLPKEPTDLINDFLAEIKAKKIITTEFPYAQVSNRVEVIDQAANGKQVAYIDYDPISGFIHYRGTDAAYRKKGWSEYLYNKAGSITRIRHSRNLTDAGRGSAHRMGGFMANDDVFDYGTPSKLKEFIKSRKKKKKIIITRDMLPPAPTPPYPRGPAPTPPYPRVRAHPDFDPRDGVGAQYDRMLEYPQYSRILDSIRPEVREWFENPYRRSHNFPYGQNSYVEPEFLDELMRLKTLEQEAAARTERSARAAPLHEYERQLRQAAARTRAARLAEGLVEAGAPDGFPRVDVDYLAFAGGGYVNTSSGYVNPAYFSNMSMPSYYTGAKYVYDDTIAQLHKGEMIVPSGMNPNNPFATNATGSISINMPLTVNAAPGMDEDYLVNKAAIRVQKAMEVALTKVGTERNITRRYQ